MFCLLSSLFTSVHVLIPLGGMHFVKTLDYQHHTRLSTPCITYVKVTIRVHVLIALVNQVQFATLFSTAYTDGGNGTE